VIKPKVAGLADHPLPGVDSYLKELKKSVDEKYKNKGEEEKGDVEQQKEKQDALAPEKTEVEKAKSGGPDCSDADRAAGL